MSDQQQIRTISIEPTPDGYRGMKRLFLETQEQSQQKIDYAQRVYDEMEDLVSENRPSTIEVFVMTHFSLLRDGLEALIAQEHRRIASMQEGIDELEKGGY